jgi:hypothetical protein
VNEDPGISAVWFQRLDSPNEETGTPAKYVTNVDGETGELQSFFPLTLIISVQ